MLKDVLLPLLGMYSGIISVILLVVVIFYPIDYIKCWKYSEATGKETKMHGLSCYVNTIDGWQAKESLTYIVNEEQDNND